jgi:hypothetical protein
MLQYEDESLESVLELVARAKSQIQSGFDDYM